MSKKKATAPKVEAPAPKVEEPKAEEPVVEETKWTKAPCGVSGCERFVRVREGVDVSDIGALIASSASKLPVCKSTDPKCLVQLAQKASK